MLANVVHGCDMRSCCRPAASQWRHFTFFFFDKYSINTDIYIRMITHSYKYMYIHPTHMSTSERLNHLDLEIHEVSHQEHLAVDGNVVSN
jgi:hypothetical protein